MSRLFYHVMQDNLGNLLFDVSGTFRLAGTGTLATIYGDEGLTIPLGNPMTNHPSFASFKCYLAPGMYDFYMAKSGYTFETLTGIQGLGTMAQQQAGAVSITGGTAVLTSAQAVQIGIGTIPEPAIALAVVGTSRLTGQNVLGSGAMNANEQNAIYYDKAARHALVFRPSGSDAGSGTAATFCNIAGGTVGTITTNASATAYNTSSDARLKEAIAPLTGAMEVIRALQPVSFLWKADGSVGHGLVAQEVQAVLPGVVSGDAASAAPMGIDYSKIVPYLIGAVKDLTQQVERLTARLEGHAAS